MKWFSFTICLVVLNAASCEKETTLNETTEPPVIMLTSGETKVSSNGNLLAFEFLDMITQDQATSGEIKNVMISPLSLNLAMAMAWNGAQGNTKEQIKDALGFTGITDQDINGYFRKMMETLPFADALSKVHIANSIWYHNEFPVKPGFLQTNNTWFKAYASALDFQNKTAESLNTINSWCSKNTNGMIDKILDKIANNEVMFLINALYFKAPWKDKFNKTDTAPMTFELSNGEKSIVPAMFKSMKTENFQGEGFNSITLPFGNGTFKASIILPTDGTDLERLCQIIASGNNWENITSMSRTSQVDIYLPKFKFEYDLEFNDLLKGIGITDAFDNNANFTGIAEYPVGALRISKVLQKTAIEINEEGGEAAAVTSIGFELTSAGPDKQVFRADKPFLFAIWEQSTNAILFAGKVEDPLGN